MIHVDSRYDQGLMSGIITHEAFSGRLDHTGPYFKDYFDQPSGAEIETIVEVSALYIWKPRIIRIIVVSSLAVGRIGDIIGWRRTIGYGALIFITGGIFQACAGNIVVMILGVLSRAWVSDCFRIY